MNSGRGVGVIDGRVFIRAIQGMEFLAQTGPWDPKEQAAVRKWFQDYLHWLTTSEHALDEKNSGNSHAAWWTAQTAAVATFVGDDSVEKMAWSWYRDQILGLADPARRHCSARGGPHQVLYPIRLSTWKRWYHDAVSRR